MVFDIIFKKRILAGWSTPGGKKEECVHYQLRSVSVYGSAFRFLHAPAGNKEFSVNLHGVLQICGSVR